MGQAICRTGVFDHPGVVKKVMKDETREDNPFWFERSTCMRCGAWISDIPCPAPGLGEEVKFEVVGPRE